MTRRQPRRNAARRGTGRPCGVGSLSGLVTLVTRVSNGDAGARARACVWYRALARETFGGRVVGSEGLLARGGGSLLPRLLP